jgi:hypothetical protein
MTPHGREKMVEVMHKLGLNLEPRKRLALPQPGKAISQAMTELPASIKDTIVRIYQSLESSGVATTVPSLPGESLLAARVRVLAADLVNARAQCAELSSLVSDLRTALREIGDDRGFTAGPTGNAGGAGDAGGSTPANP